MAFTDYSERASRMIRRWSGVRDPPRKPSQQQELPRVCVARRPPSLWLPALYRVALRLASLWRRIVSLAPVAKLLCAPAAEDESSQPAPFQDEYVEPARSIPVSDTCDVLVVGGGPAGLSAAVAAARAGASTMLIERHGCFGGCITVVGMETLGWYRYEGVVECETGIGMEMERMAARMGGTVKWPFNSSECLDADYFKIVADHLVSDAGVKPLLHTIVVEAIHEGGALAGVIVENKSGRSAVRAKRVIDCTGDADVAYLAGARCTKRDRRERMGVSTVFSCSGVDKQAFIDYTETNPATYKTWSRRGGEWCQQTADKEEHLRSPFLQEEFEKAIAAGVIPATPSNMDLGGSWSALSDAGEAPSPPPPSSPPSQPIVTPDAAPNPPGDQPEPGPSAGGGRHRRGGAYPRRDGGARADAPCDRGAQARGAGLREEQAAQLRDAGGRAGHAQDRRPVRSGRGGRARRGALRRLGRHLSGVCRRLQYPHPADDGPLLPGAAALHAVARRRQPPRRGPLRRGRQGEPRGDAQHDGLHRHRPRRGRCSSRVD